MAVVHEDFEDSTLAGVLEIEDSVGGVSLPLAAALKNGSYGCRISHALGGSSNVRYTLGSTGKSFGYWVRFHGITQGTTSYVSILFDSDWGAGIHVYYQYETSRNVIFTTRTGEIMRHEVSEDTWYWVTGYYIGGGTGTVALYDASGTLIVSQTFTCDGSATVEVAIGNDGDQISGYYIDYDDFSYDVSPTGIIPPYGISSSITLTGIGGIATAGSLGSISLAPTLSLSAIGSAEAIGSESVAASLGAGAIPSAQTLGSLSLAAGVIAAGLASVEAVGSPAIAAGLSLGGIATGESIGSSAASLFIGLAGVPSGETSGSPSIAASVSGGAIPSAEAVGSLSVGEARIYVEGIGGIGSSEAVGSVSLSISVGLRAIESQEAVGNIRINAAPFVPSPGSTIIIKTVNRLGVIAIVSRLVAVED